MKSFIALFCCLFFIQSTAFSIDRTWQGGPLRNWNNPDNWSPVGVPTRSDRVLIPNAAVGGPIVNPLDTAFAERITIENTIDLTIQGTMFIENSIQCDGDIEVSGSLLSISLSLGGQAGITLNDVLGCFLKNTGKINKFSVGINGAAEFINEGLFEEGSISAQDGTLKNNLEGTIKDSGINSSLLGNLINEGKMLSIEGLNINLFNKSTGSIKLNGGGNTKKWINQGQIDINIDAGVSFLADSSCNNGVINIAGPFNLRNNTFFKNDTSGLINILDSPNGQIVLRENAQFNNLGKIFLDNPNRTQITGSNIFNTNEAFNNQTSGIVFGTGSIDGGVVVSNGTISIGKTIDSSIGTLVASSSSDTARFGLGHTFHFEIAGYGGGGDTLGHDSLRWSSVPFIGGTLNVSLINNFTPVAQDSFMIISGHNPAGITFDSVNLPVLSGLKWEVVYTTFDVYLKVVKDACEHPDFPALKALYTSTDGDNWTNKTNWDTTGANCNVCNWHGITCTDGRVTTINLSNNGLNGNLPTEIGNFTNLAFLNLDNNQLTGTIPSTLGDLPKVKGIRMTHNQLNGNIPTELGNLDSLTVLRFDNNQLNGTIPTELGNLSKLSFLFLPNNQLGGTIPVGVASLPDLFWVDLSHNQLTGTIPAGFGNAPNLSELDLSNNQLEGGIPSELGNLNRLTLLRLDTNKLAGCLPENLKNLCDTTTVNLFNNPNLVEQDFAVFCASNSGSCDTTTMIQDSVMLTTNLSNEKDTVISARKIVANIIIQGNGAVTFQACDTITLQPPFEVQAGRNFTAIIDNCPNSEVRSIETFSKNSILSLATEIASTELKVYPNPFTHQMTIEYKLEKAATVSVQIIDILGQRVSNIVNSEPQLIGQHQIIFNRNQLKAGTYFLVFTDGNKYESRKLLMVD